METRSISSNLDNNVGNVQVDKEAPTMIALPDLTTIVHMVTKAVMEQLKLIQPQVVSNKSPCQSCGCVGSSKNVGLNNVSTSEPTPNSSETTFMHMKPPKFDGTSSWSDFLVQFEMVAKYNNWDEEEKACWLGVSLRGVAQTTLGNLEGDEKHQYASLVAHLNERFGTDHKAEL